MHPNQCDDGLIDAAAEAVRRESGEEAASSGAHADAIWGRHQARRRRRARRVRGAGAAAGLLLCLTAGTISVAGVDNTVKAVRRVLVGNFTVNHTLFSNSPLQRAEGFFHDRDLVRDVTISSTSIGGFAELSRLANQEFTVEAWDAESFASVLEGGDGEELRTGLVVDDVAWVSARRDDSGLTFRGHDADDAVIGTITISADGSTITATGRAFIIAGPRRRPDVNRDGVVDAADVAAVLGAWGDSGGAADVNNDRRVDGDDLFMVADAIGD